jgi:glycosyltransferase involved in cell wall biosynthesis
VQIEEEPRTQVAAVATALARRMKIPTIAVTGEVAPAKLPIMQRRYAGQTLRGAAGVIATNPVAARHLATHQGAQAIIPLAGVHPPLHPVTPDEGPFVIGFAGRLVRERGLDVLFEACRQVHGDWALTVVGSGPGQETLEALAERLGIAARVNWRGGLPAEDWADLWPTLQCLVVPSRTMDGWEDHGGPHLLEAMAHGVPVIVSDTPALVEMVGTAGVPVPAEDPGALAGALRELQQSPERRRSLAGAARQRALDEFTDDAIARRTMSFWQRSTSKVGAATP